MSRTTNVHELFTAGAARSGTVETMERKTDNRRVSTDCIGILRALVEGTSEREAAELIGVARATLGRILASLPVTPAVAFMVETKLRDRAARVA